MAGSTVKASMIKTLWFITATQETDHEFSPTHRPAH